MSSIGPMARWTWEMSGLQVPSRPGAMTRDARESGEVEAESAGGAVEWVVRYGPWDCFDQDEGLTIRVEPANQQVQES